jgi:hypothetical protein
VRWPGSHGRLLGRGSRWSTPQGSPGTGFCRHPSCNGVFAPQVFPGAMTGCVTPLWETLRRGSGSHPAAPGGDDARSYAASASWFVGDDSRIGRSAGSGPLAARTRLPARPRRRRPAAGARPRPGDREAAPRRPGRGRGPGSRLREARLPLPRRLEPRADRVRRPGRRRVGSRVAGAPRTARLRGAALAGEISWTVARKIVGLATPENEAACLETVPGAQRARGRGDDRGRAGGRGYSGCFREGRRRGARPRADPVLGAAVEDDSADERSHSRSRPPRPESGECGLRAVRWPWLCWAGPYDAPALEPPDSDLADTPPLDLDRQFPRPLRSSSASTSRSAASCARS